VVAMAAFSDGLNDLQADIVLPMAAFTETSGTLVNMEGSWQSFQGVVAPKGEARPGWKVLRVLGTLANLDGFDLDSSEEVLAEAKTATESTAQVGGWSAPSSLGSEQATASIGHGIYAVDPLVRRSEALQQSHLGQQKGELA